MNKAWEEARPSEIKNGWGRTPAEDFKEAVEAWRRREAEAKQAEDRATKERP